MNALKKPSWILTQIGVKLLEICACAIMIFLVPCYCPLNTVPMNVLINLVEFQLKQKLQV